LTAPVVITGASGFLGRHLITHFLAAGRTVVALTRQPASLDDLTHPQLRVAASDYGPSVALHLSSGCSLIHLAAQRNAPKRRAEQFTQANVFLPESLARHALDKGVRRFIHVSTALVLGPSPVPLDATDALVEGGSAYVRTRVAGLLAVERVAAEGLPLVTLLPPIIYGPDFARARNRITDHLRRVLRAPLRIAIGTNAPRRNLVFVDDVTQAIARAERAREATGRHLLSGDNVTQNELEMAARAAIDASIPPRIVIPSAAAIAAGRVADALLRFDRSSGWTARMQTLLAPWCLRPYALPAFDDGVEPAATPFALGIRRTVEMLRTHEKERPA